MESRALSQRFRRSRRKRVKKAGKRLFRGVNGLLALQSRIGDEPVFDPSEFDWTRRLEAGWRPIREELDALLELKDEIPCFHEISPDQRRISKGRDWKTFFLYGFDHRADANCDRCPRTLEILSGIPGLRLAMFSILEPGYHVPPHRGVTKGVLRCHLALRVPQERDRCVIRIDDEIHAWEEGRCLVFDDTYEHEVLNQTDEVRVVLFLDVDRPMDAPGRLLSHILRRMIRWTAYVRDARRNVHVWERRFTQAVEQRTKTTSSGEGEASIPIETEAGTGIGARAGTRPETDAAGTRR